MTMTVFARAPVRVDFAGGWSDVPEYAARHGGRVTNAAVSLYAHVECRLGEGKIRLISEDTDQRLTIPDATGLLFTGTLDLHKAALLMLPVGGGIEILSRSDVPAGSGLGGSGALDVALLGALARCRRDEAYEPADFAELGFELEADHLGLAGGRQDQYAAALGGFNDLLFLDGPPERTKLPLDADTAARLRDHAVIVYTGQSHFSSQTHERVWEAFRDRRRRVVQALTEIARLGGAAAEVCAAGDWRALAEVIGENWRCQQHLDETISTPRTEEMEAAMRKAGAWGVKATGAGAGGCLFALSPPDRREAVDRAAEAVGGQVLEWAFDLAGVTTWETDDETEAAGAQ